MNECSHTGEEESSETGARVEIDGGSPRIDEIFHVLRHRRRRFVLLYLQDNDIASVDDLARELATTEVDDPQASIPADRYQRVAADLVHTHLPKLAEAHVIEYDPRSQTVRSTELSVLLEKLLQLLARPNE